MRRVIRLLEQCLPAFACLSGAVVPLDTMIGDGPPPVAAKMPDLDAQMREIVGFIVRQEQMWQPGRGTKRPSSLMPRKPRRS